MGIDLGAVTYLQDYCSHFALYLQIVRADEEERQAQSIPSDPRRQSSANISSARMSPGKSTVAIIAAQRGMRPDQVPHLARVVEEIRVRGLVNLEHGDGAIEDGVYGLGVDLGYSLDTFKTCVSTALGVFV